MLLRLLFRFTFLICRRLFLNRFFLLSRQITSTKHLVEQRECCGLTFHLIILLVPFDLSKHAAHLIGQIVQVFLRETHLLYCSINLRNPQTTGAFQAIAFIHSHTVLNLRNEDNGDIFLAFCTQFRLHTHHSISAETISYLFRQGENNL